MNACEWTSPADLKTALGQVNTTAADAMLVTAGNAKAPKNGATLLFKAGGVDLLDLLKEGLVTPSRVVSLKALPGPDHIRTEPETGLHIGPMVTLGRLEKESELRASYPALAEAVAHAATIQLRNAATLGGNLMQRPRCWYFRNEHFVCRKKGGEKCFANEGENKFHAIFNNGFCSAVHASTLSTALVALGTVRWRRCPVPLRARGAEAALVGQAANEETAAAAAKAAVAGATPLSQNAYKVSLLEAVVRRAIMQAVG